MSSSASNQNDSLENNEAQNENLNIGEKKREVVLKKKVGCGSGLNLMKQVPYVKWKL